MPNPRSKKTATALKATLTATATGAVYLMPGMADGAIITMADVGGSPFSGSSASLEASSIFWDVDNDSTPDIQFVGNSGVAGIGVLGTFGRALGDSSLAVRNPQPAARTERGRGARLWLG